MSQSLNRPILFAVLMFSLALLVHRVDAQSTPPAAPNWTPLGGLYEGNVGGFKEDAAGNLWVTSSGNGVFKSTDAGDTWTAVNDGLTCWSTSGFAISPKTGEMFVGSSGRNGGVFKLAKDGKSWQSFNKGLPKPWPDPTAFNVAGLGFNKAGDLFMGSYNSVISRLPAGADSWQATGDIKPQSWKGFVEAADGRMWANGMTMLASTTDAGATWTMAEMPQVPKMPISQIMCLTVDDEAKVLLAGGRLGKWGGSGGVFRSADNGKTWTPSGLTGLQVNSIKVTGGKVFAGCRKETDFGALYVSSDHGATWTEVKGLDDLWTVHGISVTKHGIFVGANNGYRSTDGGETFQKLNIPAVQYCGSIVVLDNGDIYTGGDMFGGFNAHGVSRLLHGTTSWKTLNQGLLSMDITTLIKNTKGEVLAGDKYETTYRLVGNGDVWTKSNFKHRLGAQELVLATNGDVLAGTATSGSFISNDGGTTFVPSQMAPCQVNDFCVTPDGKILAGVEKGGSPGDWLMISTDNGKTYAGGFGIPTSAANSTWAIGPSPKGTILLSTGGGIDEYLGDGKWRKAAGGLPGAIAARDFILNKAGTKVFAGTTAGVYFSTDGQNWQPFSAGLPPAANEVHSLAFDSQGYLYAGTVSGLFKTTMPQDK